jgi:predicted permease
MNEVFKLLSILLAAIPVILFLRAVIGRSTVMKRAVSDFRRQVDYLVWVMLIMIAAGMIFSLVNLTQPLWR